jgi:pimeloyl-ACP methyl ester carboxylesterase
MPDNPASTIHLFNPSSQPTKRTYIIYFITGNPGLIEYYRDFLTHLYALLQSTSRSDVAFHVYGRSLSGFELDVSRSGLTQRNGKLPPYTVNDQIEICERDVKRVVEDVRRKEGGDVKVVLMGHSLGTYICLELVKRFTEKQKMLQDVDGRSGGGKGGEVQIAGAVLLFATVMHLAKSPGGVRTSVCATPYFSPLHTHVHPPCFAVESRN